MWSATGRICSKYGCQDGKLSTRDGFIGGKVKYNVYKVKILLSGYGDYCYLDVLHEKARKLGGISHVPKKLGCTFLREHAVMAGNSGNDVDVLFHDSPELGIIVGNAGEELVAAYHREVYKGDPQRINRLF